jgi:hypothetical protein
MINKINVRSCCGNKAFIFESQKPVKKNHLDSFEKAGYIIPKQFSNVGLFYVQNSGLIATASFGSTRVQVRCSGNNCEELLKKFELLLDEVLKNL